MNCLQPYFVSHPLQISYIWLRFIKVGELVNPGVFSESLKVHPYWSSIIFLRLPITPHMNFNFKIISFTEMGFLFQVFFVLRKKYNQISFLHVYHHTNMAMLSWVYVKIIPGRSIVLKFEGGKISFVDNLLCFTFWLIIFFFSWPDDDDWIHEHGCAHNYVHLLLFGCFWSFCSKVPVVEEILNKTPNRKLKLIFYLGDAPKRA